MDRKVYLTESDICNIVLESINEITALHGSPSGEIVTGKFKKGKIGYLGPGIYFTDDSDRARFYAKKLDGRGTIYTVELDIHNPLMLSSPNCTKEFLNAIYGSDRIYLNRSSKQSWDTYIITTKDIKKLFSLGYDSVVYTYGGSTEYVLYDNSQIKILKKESVNESLDEIKAYHGSTTSGLNQFSLDFVNSNNDHQSLGYGIYLSIDKDTAKTYMSQHGSLYEVEIPEDNGYNYLDYDDGIVPKKVSNRIKQYIMSDKDIVDTWGLDNLKMELNMFDNIYVSNLEGTMNYFLGNSDRSSKRNAEIISSCGIVGIKSNFDALSTPIYLIYNPNNIKIINEIPNK